MGVGAVFVSTLALTRLPEPHSPPQNQPEYLAATLQTIVSFIVLGSIFIRTLLTRLIPYTTLTPLVHRRSLNPILLFQPSNSLTNTLPNTYPNITKQRSPRMATRVAAHIPRHPQRHWPGTATTTSRHGNWYQTRRKMFFTYRYRRRRAVAAVAKHRT